MSDAKRAKLKAVRLKLDELREQEQRLAGEVAQSQLELLQKIGREFQIEVTELTEHEMRSSFRKLSELEKVRTNAPHEAAAADSKSKNRAKADGAG